MYSAGPDEEALDYLADPKNERNSAYARHHLPLLTDKKISWVEIAERVPVQVEEDGKKVLHQQRPAYFDGIVGHYYLANPESFQKPLGPEDRITGDNVIRLGAYATWDTRCQSRPAPRVSICAPLRYGRIVTRYETYKIPSQQFGSAHCVGTTQQGVAVYYVINPQYQAVNAFERIEVEAKHWAMSLSATTRDTFEVNLATKTTKRTARRSLTRRQ